MVAVLRYTAVLLLLTLAIGCGVGGSSVADYEAEGKQHNDIVPNRDSLLQMLALRYDVLCEERRRAYGEQDSLRRAELLRLSDERCKAFADSLEYVVSLGDK